MKERKEFGFQLRLNRAIRTVFSLIRHPLVKDTASLSTGQFVKLIVQFGYFIMLARSLGPDNYGRFVAVISLIGILNPFVGVGSTNLFVKNYQTGRRTPNVCWGNGLAVTALSGLCCTALLVSLNALIGMKIDMGILLLFCISDLILIRITDLAGAGFTACRRMAETSVQNVLTSVYRFAGIATLRLLFRHVGLEEWAVAYLIAGVVGASYSLYRAHRTWGCPALELKALREDAAEGMYFSVGASAQSIYNDIDKAMLARLSGFGAAGIYGAAYRIVDTAMTPVRALLSAACPRFFKIGVAGLGASYAYARTLISRAAWYGAGMFVFLVILAPALPFLLGSKYDAVVPVLRGLAIIPLLRCAHLFLAEALSGANLQRVRMSLQILAAAVNIALNLVILPRWSWRGAVVTSVACDALLVAILWGVCWHKGQNIRVGSALSHAA